MLYPAVMLGVGSIIMLVIFVAVIPRITKIFQQVKADLPIRTDSHLHGRRREGLLVYFVPFDRCRSSSLPALEKVGKGRPKWDRFILVAPIFGFVVRLVAIARFSRTLATLLRAGVPVLTALDITKNVLNNSRLAEVVAEAREAIREGESIAAPLRKSGEFPPIVVHMVATGEKSGQLEEMLENVADSYDFQVDQRVSSLTTLIEPILIVAMGVGVIYRLRRSAPDSSTFSARSVIQTQRR